MPSRRSHPRRIGVILALLVAGIFLVLTTYSLTRFTVKDPEIFVITDSAPAYGETLLEGRVVSNSPEPHTGEYLLILASGQPIRLDVDDFDLYLGLSVRVGGTLIPPTDTSPFPTLIISSLEAIN